MTETDTSREAVERSYLIVKRGLYYRLGSCGYIGIKELAGRYSLEEVAERFPNKDSPNQDGVSYIHEDDAPDYSEACFWDVKMQHQLDKAHARAEKAEADVKRTANHYYAACIDRDLAWNDAIVAAATELEVNWGHKATPEMRDAILALIDTEAHVADTAMPAPTMTVENEGWCDLKVAFDAESENALWDAPDTIWPSGWELFETDTSGARLVAVFRVDHLPTSDETQAVAATIRALAVEEQT